MNCKPGDLAIVVADMHKDPVDTTGFIVHVVRLVHKGEMAPLVSFGCTFYWRPDIDRWHVRSDRHGEWVHSDSGLRPIRPGDLEDETPTVRELEAA
jgi:hypothetical protein